MRQLVSFLLLAAVACSTTPTEPELRPGKPKFNTHTTSVTVTPATLSIEEDSTGDLHCAAFDGSDLQEGEGCFWKVLGTDSQYVSLNDGGAKLTDVVVTGKKVGVARVRVGNNSKADTSLVTVTAADTTPPPPPPGPADTTFFLGSAESGGMNPPWDGPIFGNNGAVPVTSTTRSFAGSRSYKFEVPASGVTSASSTVMANTPNLVDMDMPSGHFGTGYYSFYVYIDLGYTSNAWSHILGWMTGSGPSPISYIGIERWTATNRSVNGPLQLVFDLKNCGSTTYTCPTIPNYTNANAPEIYRMTSSSPAGVVTFPRQQWVKVVTYYEMAGSNGHVKVWQDDVLVMDLTAPTMDTFTGHASPNLGTNPAGDMVLQHFIYGEPDETRRIYVDEFKVTNNYPN